MPVDPIWWLALALQLVALPGTLLPVLPGLLWLPVGTGLWCWHVGWSAGWPALLLATVTFAFGLIADLLAVSLATAKLQAGRWSAPAAVVGLGFGLFAGGEGKAVGTAQRGAIHQCHQCDTLGVVVRCDQPKFTKGRKLFALGGGCVDRQPTGR